MLSADSIYPRKTHYALTIKLTTSNDVMVIVMGLNHRLSMFIYSYHIETHYLVLTYSVGLSPATVIMCFNIIHHRKTHSVLIRHLQESNLLPQILGLYQRTNALGLNVFIYDKIVNRICTCAHSAFSPLHSPTKLSPYVNTLTPIATEIYPILPGNQCVCIWSGHRDSNPELTFYFFHAMCQ